MAFRVYVASAQPADSEDAAVPVPADLATATAARTRGTSYGCAFVSYARKDFDRVSLFAQGLTQREMELAFDVASLEPGADWGAKLPEMIGRCDVFYLMWSDNAARSKWVEKEARLAVWLHHKSQRGAPRIVPITLDRPCTQAAGLPQSLPFRLAVARPARGPGHAAVHGGAAAMTETPLIPLAAVTWIGEGLKRPECVLTTAKGELFAGDHHAGIVEVGKPKRTIVGAPPGFLPNGVAMTREREFLIANLGPGGGVWRLDREWRLFPHLFEADGELLRVCNFVGVDAAGNEWISVSTRTYPRELSFRPRHADGFVVRRDAKGAHIVADGIGFTNEARVDPTGAWLYVNETCAKRISRFPVKGDKLGARETVHEFGPGEFPDGFAFDSEGACGSRASTPTASSASSSAAGAR